MKKEKNRTFVEIDTPLTRYYKDRLTEEIGEENAQLVMEQEREFILEMITEKPKRKMDHMIADFIYPVLGIANGLAELDMDEEEVKELVIRLWNEAPTTVTNKREWT